MSLVEGIMCHSIHYFTIVFNISLLQYVQLVSNVSLSCILYMLLPFDVGIIYLLDVNKCTHLVSGGIHSTFLEILLWSATEQVTGNLRYKNILLLLLNRLFKSIKCVRVIKFSYYCRIFGLALQVLNALENHHCK